MQLSGTLLEEDRVKYNKIWTEDPNYRRKSPELLFLQSLHIENWDHELYPRWLSAGCGAGAGMRYMMGKQYDVIGVDLADELAADFQDVPDRFISASLHELPFLDNRFDVTCCCDVLEHMPKSLIEQTLKELIRVTEKKLLIGVTYVASGLLLGLHRTILPAHWWLEQLYQLPNTKLDYFCGNAASMQVIMTLE